MGWAFFPLDAKLGLLAGQYTPQVYGWLVELSAWMPFAAAVKLLARLVGVKVSKATAVRAAEAAGAAYVAMQSEEVEQLERETPPATGGGERLVISADGAMVPLLHGEWGEVRTVAIGVATPLHAPNVGRSRRHRDAKQAAGAAVQPVQPVQPEVQTQQISYFSRFTSAENFTRLALVETQRRGVENARQTAAVMDGADWLQTFADHHCPQALRILDFPHAAQRIAEVAQSLWGTANGTADAQTQNWLHSLRYEGPQLLLAELRQLQQQHPANEPLRLTCAYLDKRQAQLYYPHFAQQGWPVGSGMVESANKLVVEARLKGAGMHWHRKHVDPMLALRNLVCNDRWEHEWPQIKSRLIAQTRHNRSSRSQLRLETIRRQELDARLAAQHAQYADLPPQLSTHQPDPKPQHPKTNKPAPDHPWRRSPIGKARFQNQKS